MRGVKTYTREYLKFKWSQLPLEQTDIYSRRRFEINVPDGRFDQRWNNHSLGPGENRILLSGAN